MSVRFRLWLLVFASVVLAANLVWALGFQLGESKEQLKLKYDVAVTDHGTGRVTVVLKLADQGRLDPIYSVDFVVPAKEKSASGGSRVDLSVALAAREENGAQVARIHVLRELAERGEIHLKTRRLDGKETLRTWYYYSIPIAKYLPDAK